MLEPKQVEIKVIRHGKGAPGLRLIGLAGGLLPNQGLRKLQHLLNHHTFWAQKRSIKGLQKMLKESSVVVSVWNHESIVGFGRASSDGLYRAVLWDVVVSKNYQGLGIGSIIVNTLMQSECIRSVERVYVMTTNSSGFYERLGLLGCESQVLMVRIKT